MHGWFDDPIGSFKQQYNDAVAKWQDALAALDAAYAEFQANHDYAQDDPDLSARYDDLSSKVDALRTTMTTVQGAIGDARGFIAAIGSAVTGGEMADEASTNVDPMGNVINGYRGLAGLGVLPAIPWAVVALVTASVAGVWVVINQVRGFNLDVANKKIAAQNILNAQEGKPLIPLLSTDGGAAGGFWSGMPETARWAAIGLGIYMLFTYLDKHHGHH